MRIVRISLWFVATRRCRKKDRHSSLLNLV